MPQVLTSSFDSIAREYDARWTDSAVGTHQRRAVWRRIDPLFQAGDRVLDLGCGTGIDALHLNSLGVQTYAVDRSSRMITIARERGVDAHCESIEDLQNMRLSFDGAISNFGALNCVESLRNIASALGGWIRPLGYAAVCLMGRACLWETAFFLARGEVQKAFRRLSGTATSSIGVKVFYPSRAQMVSSFTPEFRLVQSCGIGLFVPPSYVRRLDEGTVERLAVIDRHMADWPLLRSLSDHRLYIFQRL